MFRNNAPFSKPEYYVKDTKKINGLLEYSLNLRENLKPIEVSMLQLIPTNDGGTRLNFTRNFQPGCVVAVK